jgi:ribosomal silencing factor RsfS
MSIIIILLLLIWILFLEYRISKITNILNNKMNDIFELNIKYVSTIVDVLVLFLRQKDILNQRQYSWFFEEIENKLEENLKTNHKISMKWEKERKRFMIDALKKSFEK